MKGTNQIVLETNGGSGPNFDRMTITPPVCALDIDAAALCEAEAALSSSAAGLASQASGWTGDGFVDMFAAEGAVNWVLEAPQAGATSLPSATRSGFTRHGSHRQWGGGSSVHSLQHDR